MSDAATDVIVVGAGFAGVVAARELAWLGLSARVLEGRDRLGGRTWFEDRMGTPLELGGGWVHWLQQFVWSELVRYGMVIEPTPVPELVCWMTSAGRHVGTPREFDDWLGDAAERVVAGACELFPRPFDQLFANETVRDLDDSSVAKRIDQLRLDPARRELVASLWAGHLNAPSDRGALTEALRFFARARGQTSLLDEVSGGYRIQGGTGRLCEAIAADGASDIRLCTVVTRIEQSPHGIVAIAATGERFIARAAIVTVPRNALGGIEFVPPLSAAKRAAIGGNASQGLKVWLRIDGNWPPFLALSPSDFPLNNLASEFHATDHTIAVGFGVDARRLDGNDVQAVQRCVSLWFPDMSVLASASHDWVADELSRETWPALPPRQLTRLPEVQQPDGAVHLAGSDYANGWAGYIDGAIESGLRVARTVAGSL